MAGIMLIEIIWKTAQNYLLNLKIWGFPGGAVVENLPANAGDTGSSPGLGGSRMPRSGWAREPQLLSLRVWSLCSAAGQAVIVRGPCTIVAVPIYIPTNSVRGFPFLHTLSSICNLQTFFFNRSLLEYNCFIIACQFLLHNKANQPYAYTCPHIPSLLSLHPTLPIPSLQVTTKHRADLPVLCCCFPPANYFTFGSVYMSMLLSLCPSFTLLPHVIKSILYIYFFIPALQIGSSVPIFFFRFHIYV